MKLNITPLVREIYSGADASTTEEEWRFRRHALRKAVEALATKNGASQDSVESYLASADALASRAEAHFGQRSAPTSRSRDPGEADHIGAGDLGTVAGHRASAPARPNQKPRFHIAFWGELSLIMAIAFLVPQLVFASHVWYWPIGVAATTVVLAGVISVLFGSHKLDVMFNMLLVAAITWAYLFYPEKPVRLNYVADFIESTTAGLAPVPVPDPQKDRKLAELLGAI